MFDRLRRRGGPGETGGCSASANGQLAMTSTAVKVRGWKCMEVNLVREHTRSRMIRGYSIRPGQTGQKKGVETTKQPCAPVAQVSADISTPT